MLLELALYSSMSLGWFAPQLDGAYFDKPPMAFDPIRGARWLQNGVRTFRIARGELIYGPFQLSVNARGVMGSIEGTAGPRIAVVGDSFTDLSSAARNWVSRVNAQHRATLVSFALDGSGGVNWRNTFFNEILKDPRGFDALIIAVYQPDFYRRFFAMTSDQDFLYGNRYDRPDLATEKDVRQCPIAYVVSPAEMAWTLAVTRKEFSYGLNAYWIVRHYMNDWYSGWRRALGCHDYLFEQPRFDLLEEMVNAAHAAKMEVIVAIVPDRDLVPGFIQEGKHSRQEDGLLRFVRDHHLPLFDGYQAFAHARPQGIAPQSFVSDDWLRSDGHWNQAGSDIFADAISKFIADVVHTH